ncbi:cytidylyltransferase domain-containing protein [Alicyclobacillus macrosporangiidus]|uniref:acylneuraminate cytidylyltransferase family protein n=1 Tax=Alicyclobacillus macrosporangiidus TaxID=392015 RepID=UPI0004971F3D|nr:acylneuraminate cytidylyltransferase family protein [Alicyclobacillus macrosporangiidus]
MKRICTICARAGSKGVPDKNIRNLLGKPLIAHSVLQAQCSELFDEIAVSSDSDHILRIAEAYGVRQLVLRPPELACDDAPKLPAIQHCVEEVERIVGYRFDTVVDLDVTSPLRTVDDIAAAVCLLEQSDAQNVLSCTPSRRSPYFNMVEVTKDGTVALVKPPAASVTRRQDAPVTYDLNASVYVWQRDSLFDCGTLFNPRTLLYVMPAERSLDIDTRLDFDLVEYVLSKRRVNP